MKNHKKHKKAISREQMVQNIRDLYDEFLRKGFTTEQAFQLLVETVRKS